MTTYATARLRREHNGSRYTFLLVIATVFTLTILSSLYHNVNNGARTSQSLSTRDNSPLDDLDCRRVHQTEDKCAFVRRNCPDEEAGIFSYLSLYYCALARAKPVAFAIIVLWLGLLFSTIGIAASDFFSVNLSTIAKLLGLSDNLAGVTFLAFGNGSPDIFSTFAAMKTNSGSLAVGELIGAASFITAVIAGSIAFIRPFKVGRKSFVRDVCFFIIAASFSLVFLADGKLSLWEACVLVGLYVFYVLFVLIWHWWLHRRRRRQQKEAAAREHFIGPGSEDVDASQQYVDEEEEGMVSRSMHSTLRGVSADDLAALERGSESDDEAAEEEAEHAAVEINRRMRLSRPGPGQRRHTHYSIRPSLVGALEYRALLTDLQRSSNMQSTHIHLRRYSDGGRASAPQVVISDPQAGQSSTDDAHTPSEVQRRTATGSRIRAVSVNDMEVLKQDTSNVPQPDLLSPVGESETSAGLSREQSKPTDTDGSSVRPPSLAISVSPPSSDHSHERSTTPPQRVHSPTHLSLPKQSHQSTLRGTSLSSSSSSSSRAMSQHGIQTDTGALRRSSVSSASISSFPPYTDEPLQRPQSIRQPDSPTSPLRDEYLLEEPHRPAKWWPYAYLPPPEELCSALFPTLYRWKEQTILQKIIGVISAPSVFLLTITLPVVESSHDDDDDRNEEIPELSLPGTRSSQDANAPPKISITVHDRADSTTPLLSEPQHSSHASSSGEHGVSGHADVTDVAVSAEQRHERANPEERVQQFSDRAIVDSPEQIAADKAESEKCDDDWRRWLVCIQLFMAPAFMVVILWANTDQEHPRALLRPLLIALAVSGAGLLLVLGTTSAARPPRWRLVLCLLGFAVSIAWISSIANEVVGVLKALGVILNISDAILGLTIFAVGNSCGDLVANITVAKLGYPVMALSACFGGPMLNILLGIGISGMYLILTAARDKVDKHPGKKWKIKPYHIDVSKTLLISGGTLLVTLVVLLVVIPIKKWRMDRSLGWILITIWLVSTIANVAVELSGLGTTLNS